MASITKYRSKWLKYHKGYEKRAYKELQKVFRKYTNKVVNTNFTDKKSIKKQLEQAVTENDMFNTYYQIYFNVGVAHGQRVGKDINVELTKDFTIPKFMTLFEKDLPKYLKKHGITRIQQVNKTYLDDVFALFNKRLLDGKTLKETTAEVFKVMKSPRFYKYQAERIARTETTAAANYGAIQSGAVSGYVMNKRWISALDKRTRTFSDGNYDHAQMNSKIVGEKEPFNVSGEKLMYPGDPNGSAGNVINCRCTVAVIPARDRNGNLIRTGVEPTTIKPTTPKLTPSQIREKNIVDYEKTIRNNNFESAGVFDDAGNVVFKKRGKSREVNFEWYEIEQSKGKHLTHNHPLDYSFSKEDVHFAIGYELAEIRAVTSKRTFILKPLKYITNKKEMSAFKRTITTTEKQMQRDLSVKVRSGEITKAEYENMYFDELWLRVKKGKYKDYFEYTKIDG